MQRNTKFEKIIIKQIKHLPESKMPMVLQFVEFISSQESKDYFESKKAGKRKVNKSVAGSLKKYANPLLMKKEKEIAWNKVVTAK